MQPSFVCMGWYWARSHKDSTAVWKRKKEKIKFTSTTNGTQKDWGPLCCREPAGLVIDGLPSGNDGNNTLCSRIHSYVYILGEKINEEEERCKLQTYIGELEIKHGQMKNKRWSLTSELRERIVWFSVNKGFASPVSCRQRQKFSKRRMELTSLFVWPEPSRTDIASCAFVWFSPGQKSATGEKL